MAFPWVSPKQGGVRVDAVPKKESRVGNLTSLSILLQRRPSDSAFLGAPWNAVVWSEEASGAAGERRVMNLRPARNSDMDSVVRLIDGVYREYGDKICLDDVDKDLGDLVGYYREGLFMVLEEKDEVRGTVALVPSGLRPGICELKRLYLHGSLRGSGWAERLVNWAAEEGRIMNMRRMELWTDTRFERAHAFYRRLGFGFDGVIRIMNDGWEPYREFFFYSELPR